MVLITFPTGGVGSQIYVQATGVNLSDLTLDGGNNATTACGYNNGPFGIYYFDSTGVINHVAIRNEIPSGPGLVSCFQGVGILVWSSSNAANVTIQNSSIHGFQYDGIDAYYRGTNVTVKNNSIGGNAQGPGSNGIAILFGGTGSVTSNSIINVNESVTYPNIGGAGYGVLIDCSQGVIVSGNTIGDTQVGILLNSGCGSGSGGNADGNTITQNKISQTHIFDGIYVCGDYDAVQFNTVNSASEAGIRIDTGCNSGASGFFNTVTNNTVDEACMMILQDPISAGANTVGSNTDFSVVFDTLIGTLIPSGTCSNAPTAPSNGGNEDWANSERFNPTSTPPPGPKQQ